MGLPLYGWPETKQLLHKRQIIYVWQIQAGAVNLATQEYIVTYLVTLKGFLVFAIKLL